MGVLTLNDGAPVLAVMFDKDTAVTMQDLSLGGFPVPSEPFPCKQILHIHSIVIVFFWLKLMSLLGSCWHQKLHMACHCHFLLLISPILLSKSWTIQR